MLPSTCPACRHSLRLRLHWKVAVLQRRRYSAQQDPPSNNEEESADYSTLLRGANSFFQKYKAKPSWVGSEWRKLRTSTVPEVAFVGTTNVGKSSLINKLAGEEICNIGPTPGKTRELRAYAFTARKSWGGAGRGGEMDDKFALLDTPGYGFAGDKVDGDSIVRYLLRRQQLRKVFVCMDVGKEKRSREISTLALLREFDIPFQIILTKVDKLYPNPSQTEQMSVKTNFATMFNASGLAHREQTKNGTTSNPFSGARQSTGRYDPILPEDVLLTGNVWNNRGKRMIDEVRWAVLVATRCDRFVNRLTGELRDAPSRADAASLLTSRTLQEIPGLSRMQNMNIMDGWSSDRETGDQPVPRRASRGGGEPQSFNSANAAVDAEMGLPDLAEADEKPHRSTSIAEDEEPSRKGSTQDVQGDHTARLSAVDQFLSSEEVRPKKEALPKKEPSPKKETVYKKETVQSPRAVLSRKVGTARRVTSSRKPSASTRDEDFLLSRLVTPASPASTSASRNSPTNSSPSNTSAPGTSSTISSPSAQGVDPKVIRFIPTRLAHDDDNDNDEMPKPITASSDKPNHQRPRAIAMRRHRKKTSTSSPPSSR